MGQAGVLTLFAIALCRSLLRKHSNEMPHDRYYRPRAMSKCIEGRNADKAGADSHAITYNEQRHHQCLHVFAPVL